MLCQLFTRARQFKSRTSILSVFSHSTALLGMSELFLDSLYNFNTLKPRIPLMIIMDNTVGNHLEVLCCRLNEAERRAKLLKLEVKSIRQEIATLQQNIASTQSASANTIVNTLNRERRTILLDAPPNTNSVDGAASNKRPNDGSGPSDSKKSREIFIKKDGYVEVYTDGACENNGKSNAKAGIGVWFGDGNPLNISRPVEGKATNNTAEIQACVQALRVIKDNGENRARIYTDSEFTINCMTKWIQRWRKNNWKTAGGGTVKNKEDLQVLDSIISTFSDVQWTHVAGHAGNKGNEEADRLARDGALRYQSN